MLDFTGAGATATSTIDWRGVWKKSPEAAATAREVQQIRNEGRSRPAVGTKFHAEYSTPWIHQTFIVARRSAAVIWRDPTYYAVAKLMTNIAAGLFIGFSTSKPHLIYRISPVSQVPAAVANFPYNVDNKDSDILPTSRSCRGSSGSPPPDGYQTNEENWHLADEIIADMDVPIRANYSAQAASMAWRTPAALNLVQFPPKRHTHTKTCQE